MQSSEDLYKKWKSFLAKFKNEEQDIFANVESENNSHIQIVNFLGTNIKLNTCYGFLTLDFRDPECQWDVQDFLAASNINFDSQKIHNIKLIKTTFSEEEFPCRIYGAENKGRIRFYQSDKITDFNELFESFVTVYHNVCVIVFRLKINTVLKHLN